jgi:hypothetical protein
LPSVEQVELAVVAHSPCGSDLPAATARQVPSTVDCGFGKLHAMHAPQAADAQQTPSTQLPVPHSVPPAQAWPALFRHLFPKHPYPAATSQAALELHDDAHWPPEHRYPTAQATEAPGVQVPLPLQVPVVLAAWWLSTHALWSGVQVEPLHFSHVPEAVHLPSVPHELLVVTEQRP